MVPLLWSLLRVAVLFPHTDPICCLLGLWARPLLHISVMQSPIGKARVGCDTYIEFWIINFPVVVVACLSDQVLVQR